MILVNLLNFDSVEEKIIILRGIPVILDSNIAELYGVETKRVIEAVSNNPEKFPFGFIFELEKQEFAVLRSKISTLKISFLFRKHQSKTLLETYQDYF